MQCINPSGAAKCSGQWQFYRNNIETTTNIMLWKTHFDADTDVDFHSKRTLQHVAAMFQTTMLFIAVIEFASGGGDRGGCGSDPVFSRNIQWIKYLKSCESRCLESLCYEWPFFDTTITSLGIQVDVQGKDFADRWAVVFCSSLCVMDGQRLITHAGEEADGSWMNNSFERQTLLRFLWDFYINSGFDSDGFWLENVYFAVDRKHHVQTSKVHLIVLWRLLTCQASLPTCGWALVVCFHGCPCDNFRITSSSSGRQIQVSRDPCRFCFSVCGLGGVEMWWILSRYAAML